MKMKRCGSCSMFLVIGNLPEAEKDVSLFGKCRLNPPSPVILSNGYRGAEWPEVKSDSIACGQHTPSLGFEGETDGKQSQPEKEAPEGQESVAPAGPAARSFSPTQSVDIQEEQCRGCEADLCTGCGPLYYGAENFKLLESMA